MTVEKRTVCVEKKIDHCYHNCPYFSLDGGPGPVMVCDHPDVPSPYIISHPKCQTGFPEKCPLPDICPSAS